MRAAASHPGVRGEGGGGREEGGPAGKGAGTPGEAGVDAGPRREATGHAQHFAACARSSTLQSACSCLLGWGAVPGPADQHHLGQCSVQGEQSCTPPRRPWRSPEALDGVVCCALGYLKCRRHGLWKCLSDPYLPQVSSTANTLRLQPSQAPFTLPHVSASRRNGSRGGTTGPPATKLPASTLQSLPPRTLFVDEMCTWCGVLV